MRQFTLNALKLSEFGFSNLDNAVASVMLLILLVLPFCLLLFPIYRHPIAVCLIGAAIQCTESVTGLGDHHSTKISSVRSIRD
jgi:hypothetical protein